jgi:hypothetical protein
MQTIELTGAALDWAVCKAGGGGNSIPMFWAGREMGMFEYSTDWEQGGPIIEREGIGAFCNRTVEVSARFTPNPGADWRAFAYSKHGKHYFGPTPLVAAMRCYVASKLGDEVDIPEELIK